MGWYIWPKKKAEWPVALAECYICQEIIKAGDKFHFMATDAVAHSTCVYKEQDSIPSTEQNA